jgi:hypothetical protein
MHSPSIRVQLAVVDPMVDEEHLEELASSLRAILLDADVADVEPVHRGEMPAGAKAGEVAVIGMLLVTLAQSAEAFTTVVHAVRNWLATNPSRSVKLQVDGNVIELTNATSAEQRRLIDLFIERSTGEGR